MVGWQRPTARPFENVDGDQPRAQRRCDPDVVETPSLVPLAPIPGAIAPPGKDLPPLGHEVAHDIEPLVRAFERLESFDLCLGMLRMRRSFWDELESQALMGPERITRRGGLGDRVAPRTPDRG